MTRGNGVVPQRACAATPPYHKAVDLRVAAYKAMRATTGDFQRATSYFNAHNPGHGISRLDVFLRRWATRGPECRSPPKTGRPRKLEESQAKMCAEVLSKGHMVNGKLREWDSVREVRKMCPTRAGMPKC